MAEKVLVVDDEDGIRELLVEVLVKDGYETCTAADGYEALNQFRAEKPNLLVVDLLIPGMNGYELCRRIRQSSSVPIAVITAFGLHEADRVKAFDVGADAFLTKPFNTDDFLAQVHGLLPTSQQP
jgi:DNA-binding response OmpR family regulator